MCSLYDLLYLLGRSQTGECKLRAAIPLKSDQGKYFFYLEFRSLDQTHI